VLVRRVALIGGRNLSKKTSLRDQINFTPNERESLNIAVHHSTETLVMSRGRKFIHSQKSLQQTHRCYTDTKGNVLRSALIVSNGTATPAQAWTDPEGSRRLRLADFQTIGT
jgi:hypothetical protein